MENIMRFRHNAMQVNSLSAFMGMKGGVRQNCKDVYFVRLIGTNATLMSDIRQMDYRMTERMEQRQDLIYRRINCLPAPGSTADAAYYERCYQAFLDAHKQTASSKTLKGDASYARLLASGLQTALKLYKTERPQMSASMEKNFVVKMLFWQDALLSDIMTCWHEQLSVKLVLSNITKQQEYFFAYLLTLLGCDVLLLQSGTDISPKEDALNLSQKVKNGSFQQIVIPEYNKAEILTEIRQSSCTAGNVLHSGAQAVSQNVRFSAAGASTDTSGPIVLKIPPRPGTSSKAAAGSAASSISPGRPVSAAKPTFTATPCPAATAKPSASCDYTASGSYPVEKNFEELAQLASSVVLIAIHNQNGDVIGTGSGIMIGRDGYILTNNHVASGGKYYSVRIEDDETTYSTDELIKYHSTLDLAIIRINRMLRPLPVYKGAKSLVRGQKVVAIGSPLGLFNSVSDGIISGFRKIDGVDMIQFTAPISRGSSGGAVLNMYGEVIGMSTAGIDSGQNINLAMGYECINRFISGFV